MHALRRFLQQHRPASWFAEQFSKRLSKASSAPAQPQQRAAWGSWSSSRSLLLGSGALAASSLPGGAAAAAGGGALLSAGGLSWSWAHGLTTAAGAGAVASFAEMGIWGWLLVDVAINWGGWAVAAALKTEKFYDLVGSLSFLTLTGGSLAVAGAAPRKVLVSCMVGAWALRLGSHLVARVFKHGKDSRFDEVKHQPGMFLFYWTMQALWVFVTLTPVLIVNTAASATPLRWVDLAGGLLYVVGLGLEATADAQKDAWRARPENKGKFIDEGLWSVSRHPNYLGEMTLWWGVFLVCAGGFSKPVQFASLASPMFVMFLLRYVSGVPILERQADARWGGQPEYEAYKQRVPILLPTIESILGTGPRAAA